MADIAVERVGWSELRPRIGWRQGEHVTLIGPTGSGKTTFARSLLPLRRHVAVIATKPRDPLISALRSEDGFEIARRWPPPDYVSRVVFQPPAGRILDFDSQAAEVRRMLHSVYREWNWCVYADELAELTDMGLKRELKMLWLRGRSLGISFVVATQRPRWVPLEAYSQATHLLVWGTPDRQDLNRLGEIGGVDTDLVKHTVSRLSGYDALYVNARNGMLAVTNAKE